jgi:hypothetical protein
LFLPVISLANQINKTKGLSPATIKQMQSDIESVKIDIMDMAVVANFKDTSTLTSLVASIRKDEYLTKKNFTQPRQAPLIQYSVISIRTLMLNN